MTYANAGKKKTCQETTQIIFIKQKVLFKKENEDKPLIESCMNETRVNTVNDKILKFSYTINSEFLLEHIIRDALV